MANACFKCRASLPSGRTFCDTCKSEVSLGEASTVRSRWWLLVAASALGLPVGVGLSALGSAVGLAPLTILGSVMLFGSWIGSMAGMAMDVQRLRDADAEWAPSTLVLFLYVFPCLFVVPIPLVAGYYLHRRRRHVGLGH